MPVDEFTRQWEKETESIIQNIKTVRNVGRKIIEDRQLNRRNQKDENEILTCLSKIDCKLSDVKKQAVYFLSPNLELFKQRNNKIDLYARQIQKHQYIIQLQQEVLKLKYEESHRNEGKETNDELIQIIPQATNDRYESIYLKQKQLIKETKQFLAKCDVELATLKTEVDNFQRKLLEESDDESLTSVDNEKYERYKKNVFSQYYSKAKQRIKSKSKQKSEKANRRKNLDNQESDQETPQELSNRNKKKKKRKTKKQVMDIEIKEQFDKIEPKVRKKRKESKGKKRDRQEKFEIEYQEEAVKPRKDKHKPKRKNQTDTHQGHSSYTSLDTMIEEELVKQGVSVMQTCIEWMCISVMGSFNTRNDAMDSYAKTEKANSKTKSKKREECIS